MHFSTTARGVALGLALSLTAYASAAPVKGGTLIYLEQQAHTTLYPPAGGSTPTAASSIR